MNLYIKTLESLYKGSLNSNEITLNGTKQPLFNHVTKMVQGIEPVI